MVEQVKGQRVSSPEFTSVVVPLCDRYLHLAFEWDCHSDIALAHEDRSLSEDEAPDGVA